MQPYQSASLESQRQANFPLDIAKKAGAIGSAAVTGIAGGAALNRVMPLLSKYVPEELAIKGLNKIDPRYGKFIEKALSAGQTFDQVRDFISDKGKETSEMISSFKKEVDELGTTPKEKGGNIIQKYSDQLHELISSKIKRGIPPIQAAADAKRESKGSFSKKIAQIEKDYKTDFANIVEAIYGKGDMAQSPQQAPQQVQQPGSNPNQMPQQGNPQAKDQLLQAMQALSQKLRT